MVLIVDTAKDRITVTSVTAVHCISEGKRVFPQRVFPQTQADPKCSGPAHSYLNLPLTKGELYCITVLYKILTFIMMKGSVLFDFGILIFLGDASSNLIDILLGKKMTPTTVQTVKQRNTANKRYSTLKGKQIRHFMNF